MKRGFTLLELMIVIVIIAILAMVAFPRFLAQIEKARRGQALTTMRSIRDAELANFSLNGAYTDTFPIQVDLDSDGTNDIVMADPSNNEFDYTVESAATPASAYIQAGAKGTGGDRASYSMCIESGAVTECDNAAVCAATCP